MTVQSDRSKETATLGGGCFWCLEPIFEALQGVREVVVGYAGGRLPKPNYQQVCGGATGHAEVVQVTFDPQEILYRELLEVFFSIHDPTTPNRQGADIGSQYRSIILYHNEQQRSTAQAVIEVLDGQGIWQAPIVTDLKPFTVFYRAEEYHQEYYRKNPYQGYCSVVIAPKLAKFCKRYSQRLKS